MVAVKPIKNSGTAKGLQEFSIRRRFPRVSESFPVFFIHPAELVVVDRMGIIDLRRITMHPASGLRRVIDGQQREFFCQHRSIQLRASYGCHCFYAEMTVRIVLQHFSNHGVPRDRTEAEASIYLNHILEE